MRGAWRFAIREQRGEGNHIPQGRALPSQTASEGPEFRCGRAILQSPVRSWEFYDVIPEIDIWRAATLEESASRADELASAGDDSGVAVWRRISDAVGQLVNTTPRPGPLTAPLNWKRERTPARQIVLLVYLSLYQYLR